MLSSTMVDVCQSLGPVIEDFGEQIRVSLFLATDTRGLPAASRFYLRGSRLGDIPVGNTA